MTPEPIVRDCLGNPIVGADKGWYETSEGIYDGVRWVGIMPEAEPHGDLHLATGYAVGFSSHKLPQTWFFFQSLEPALVFGRAARMSEDVRSYGVYRATREHRYDYPQGKDRTFLWLLRGSLDRREDEKGAFQAWVDGIDLQSSHWPPEIDSERWSHDRALLSRHVNLRASMLPPVHRKLPDERSTARAINSLADRLRGAPRDHNWDEAGQWTGGASIHVTTDGRYGSIGVDTDGYGGKIPADLAEVLHNVTWHAGGRMWADGYEGSISGGGGACTYWFAQFLREDAAAIMLATLRLLVDRDPTHAEWYLSSTCKGLCNAHEDPNQNVCPSHWCAQAEPASECNCRCEGEHHASGDRGMPPGDLSLDWTSMPDLPRQKRSISTPPKEGPQ